MNILLALSIQILVGFGGLCVIINVPMLTFLLCVKNKVLGNGHNMLTLSCQIETARVLLGRVFSMPTCDKSNESISNFSTEACENYWPEHL